MATEPLSKEEELDLSQIVLAVLANWRTELTLLGKAFLDQRQGPTTHLAVRPDALLLFLVEQGQEVELAQIARDSADGSLARELARAVIKTGDTRDVFLAFPEEDVLRPRLAMPHARESALERALCYEIERLTPLNPTDLYFDFKVGAPDRETGMVEIELRVVRRALIDEVVSLCHSAGLSVTGIFFEGDDKPASWRSFPVDRNAFIRRLGRRYGFVALSTIALVLLVALFAGVLLRTANEFDALTETVADAGMQAARVERLEQQVSQTANYLSYATQKKQSPLFISTLAELTRILPDNTSVTELAMEGSKVRIQGSSSAASDLIGLIDRSPAFTNAQFDAPIVHDAASNADHFDLSFDVRGVKP